MEIWRLTRPGREAATPHSSTVTQPSGAYYRPDLGAAGAPGFQDSLGPSGLEGPWSSQSPSVPCPFLNKSGGSPMASSTLRELDFLLSRWVQDGKGGSKGHTRGGLDRVGRLDTRRGQGRGGPTIWGSVLLLPQRPRRQDLALTLALTTGGDLAWPPSPGLFLECSATQWLHLWLCHRLP